MTPARLALRGALFGVFAAIPALVYLWGFTVDDALIPARYATHIAEGLGYRFNPHGPSTDGVTPLGWPYVLAPFAARGPLAALAAARALGAFAWLGATAALGAAVARVPGGPWRYASLVLVLVSAPLGAWASAGLETGVVVALSTAAAVLAAEPRFSPAGAALAGACAWLRPEMIVYAGVLGAGRAALTLGRARVLSYVLAIGPWLTAGAVRWIAWGRPAPLAVLSKPSDLASGATYVLYALLFTGAPLAVFAPIAVRRLPFWARILAVAAFAHLAAVALAGGDWMPLARLACPVLPPLVLVAAHLLGSPFSAFFARARLGIAVLAEIAVFVLRGPAARRVLGDRLTLVDTMRPALLGAARVATVDVGWVGASSPVADILDLAGATDPEIAALPGGHTSKTISGAFLTGRNADRLVFLVANATAGSDEGPSFTRVVEARLAADPLVGRNFRLVWKSPETLPIRYVIFARADGPPRPSDRQPGD